jgi:hypothetical protein
MTPRLTDPLFDGLFWDTDAAALSWHEHATFICERVLERGSLDQWNAVKARYEPEQLLTILRPSRRLSRKAVAYLSACYGAPVEEFRAWQLEEMAPKSH